MKLYCLHEKWGVCMQTEKLHVYTICFPAYDSRTKLHGFLYRIRQNFFENGVSEKKVITDYTGDVCTKYSYYISQWGMGWRKTVDNRLLEYSVPEQNGCSILFQDSDSHHYEKIVYDSDLEWVRTYYYDKFDDSQTPAHTIELVDDRGVLLWTTYDRTGGVTAQQKLYPGFSDMNSEINDVLDAKSGDPIVYAATSRGEVCFCTAEQAKLRESVMETIEPTISSLNLEDVMVSTFDWDDRGAQLFAECIELLHGADAKTEPDEMEPLLREAVKESPQDADVSAEFHRTIQETEEWIRQLNATSVVVAGETEALQETNDLFSYSNPSAKEQDGDLQEIMAIIHNLEAKNRQIALPKHKKVESEGKSLFAELAGLWNSGKKMPSRYTVAGKKTNAKMVHATEVFEPKKGSRAV